MIGHHDLHGQELLRATLAARVEPPCARLHLWGPLGVGRFHLAHRICRARAASCDGPVFVVDAAACRTPLDLLDAFVEACEPARAESPDPEALERRLLGRLQPMGATWIVVRSIDHLDEASRAWLAAFGERLLDVRWVTTSLHHVAPPGFDPVHVPPLDERSRDDRDAAARIFCDALPHHAREGVILDDTRAAALIRACGGRPLFLRRAAARARLLPIASILEALADADANEGAATVFGASADAVVDATVALLDPVARLALAFAACVPDGLQCEDVRTLSALHQANDPAAAANAHALHERAEAVLPLLVSLGLLEMDTRAARGPDAEHVVPRPFRHRLHARAPELAGGNGDALKSTVRAWMRRLFGDGLDRLGLRERPGDTRAMFRRRATLLRRAIGEDAAPHPGDLPSDDLIALSLAAHLLRHTGMHAVPVEAVPHAVLERTAPAQMAPDAFARAGRALVEAYLLARTRSAATLRDQLAARMREVATWLDEHPDARAPETAALCHYYLAVHHLGESSAATSEQAAVRAKAEADAAGRPDVSARVDSVLAFLDVERGEPGRAVQRLRAARESLESLGAEAELSALLGNYVTTLAQHGAPLLARTTAERGLEIMQRYGDTALQVRMLLVRARLRAMTEMGPDDDDLHEALRLAASIGADHEVAEARVRLGWHRLLFSDAPGHDALAAIESGVHQARRGGIARMIAYAEQSCIEALLLLGRPDEALRRLEPVLHDVAGRGRALHQAELLVLRAACRPRHPQAREDLESARALLHGMAAPNAHRLVDVTTLHVDWVQGRVDEAALGERLAPMLQPTPDAILTEEVPLPLWKRAFMLRLAMKRLLAVLPPAVVDEVLAAAADPDAAALVVFDHGRSVRLPGGAWLSFESAPMLTRLLAGITRAARAGVVARADALMDAAWPEDAGRQDESTLNRLHQAISRLRRMGLRAWLTADEGGWTLSGDVVFPDVP